MKSLKIGITLFSLLAIVSFSSAQGVDSQRVDSRTERIIAKLGLNETQAVKARALSVKYTDLIANSTDQKQKNVYKQEVDVELKKFLTTEQFLEYKEILAKEKKSAATSSERAKGAK